MATENELLVIDNGSSQTPTSLSASVGSSLRKKAIKLEKDRTIYAIYGLYVDGISLASSALKIFFDTQYELILKQDGFAISADDAMHQFELTPEGLLITAATTAFFVFFSFAGNYFKDDYQSYTISTFDAIKTEGYQDNTLYIKTEKDRIFYTLITPQGKVIQDSITIEELNAPVGSALLTTDLDILLPYILNITHKRNHTTETLHLFASMALLWQFMRTGLKGLKNTSRSMRTLLILIGKLISDPSVRGFTFSLGLAAGIISALNRILYRYLTEQRKAMMASNQQLLKTILAHDVLTTEEVKTIRTGIQKNGWGFRVICLFSAMLTGVFDGLYSYLGLLVLSTFCPPLLIVLTLISLLFVLSCILVRVYEEYQYQTNLEITIKNIEMALYSKAHIKQLKEAFDILRKTTDDAIKKQKEAEIHELIRGFREQRTTLQRLMTHSYLGAFLGGLRSGLSAYSVLSVTLFTMSSFFTFAAVAIPPALVATVILLGLATLCLLVAYHVVKAYQFQTSQKLENAEADAFQQVIDSQMPTSDAIDRAIHDNMVIKPSPQFSIQLWEKFEVLRSMASSFGKGGRNLRFLDGRNYHNVPPWVAILGLINCFGSAAVVGIRTFARNFGRPAFTPTLNMPIEKACTFFQATKEVEESGINELVSDDDRDLALCD